MFVGLPPLFIPIADLRSHEAADRDRAAVSILKPEHGAPWSGDRQTITDLERSLEPHIKLYRNVYEPLRHSYFAHRAMQGEQSVWNMFQQTNREEIGKTIQYIRDVAESLREAFFNGRKPIPLVATLEADREVVRFAVRSVLVKLAQWPSLNP